MAKVHVYTKRTTTSLTDFLVLDLCLLGTLLYGLIYIHSWHNPRPFLSQHLQSPAHIST